VCASSVGLRGCGLIFVTLEWSQVKQMGKVTNNKCSKDLANERESDRPVNSTHSLTHTLPA
jgi:hypothetical protein